MGTSYVRGSWEKLEGILKSPPRPGAVLLDSELFSPYTGTKCFWTLFRLDDKHRLTCHFIEPAEPGVIGYKSVDAGMLPYAACPARLLEAFKPSNDLESRFVAWQSALTAVEVDEKATTADYVVLALDPGYYLQERGGVDWGRVSHGKATTYGSVAEAQAAVKRLAAATMVLRIEPALNS